MTRHRVALLALVVFTLVGCLWPAACTVCEEPDETKDVLPTGDYVVSGVDLDRAGEWQWMKGARVHVDREEGFMTVRYTRDGTTYDLRYAIYDPRDEE